MRAARIVAVAIFAALAACQIFGPADRAGVAQDAATIERCQELGRACKADGGAHCFDLYSACMADAGMYQ